MSNNVECKSWPVSDLLSCSKLNHRCRSLPSKLFELFHPGSILHYKIVIVDNSLPLRIIGHKLQKQNWKLRKNCFQSISEKARLHLVSPDRSDLVHFPELQNMLLDCILKHNFETKLTIDFICHSLLPQLSPFIAF